MVEIYLATGCKSNLVIFSRLLFSISKVPRASLEASRRKSLVSSLFRLDHRVWPVCSYILFHPEDRWTKGAIKVSSVRGRCWGRAERTFCIWKWVGEVPRAEFRDPEKLKWLKDGAEVTRWMARSREIGTEATSDSGPAENGASDSNGVRELWTGLATSSLFSSVTSASCAW